MLVIEGNRQAAKIIAADPMQLQVFLTVWKFIPGITIELAKSRCNPSQLERRHLWLTGF